mgnify:CR=1 FL=1
MATKKVTDESFESEVIKSQKHRTMKTIPIRDTKTFSHYYRSYPLKDDGLL